MQELAACSQCQRGNPDDVETRIMLISDEQARDDCRFNVCFAACVPAVLPSACPGPLLHLPIRLPACQRTRLSRVPASNGVPSVNPSPHPTPSCSLTLGTTQRRAWEHA